VADPRFQREQHPAWHVRGTLAQVFVGQELAPVGIELGDGERGWIRPEEQLQEPLVADLLQSVRRL